MILYIGNKLSRYGNTPTSVETLGERLGAIFDIITVSDKQNRLLRIIEMVASIVKYRKRIDTILIDTYSTSNFYYALACAVVAKALRLPYVPILHGGNLPARLRRNPRLCRTLFGNAEICVAPSGYLHHVFSTAGYRTVLIPNTIDIDDYPFKERTNLKPKLLYVRAFSRLYHPQMALEVLRLLRKRYDDASLCMVGPDRDGTLQELRQAAERMGLAEYVSFPGKLSKEEWIARSAEYDIFINTTTVDNTPVSLIEAMALGMPVVTTDVGGIPYLVEDGEDALCVPSRDAEAMADRIITLIEDPTLARRITQAARKKAESFDWGKSVKAQWIKLLEKTV